MTLFPLQIVTIDGPVFDGQVQSLSCRSISGQLEILANHCNYCTAITKGTARYITPDGTAHTTPSTGGLLTMLNGRCRLILSSF